MEDEPDLLSACVELGRQVEAATRAIRDRHPEAVRCSTSCHRCCHDVFPVSVLEAVLVRRAFLALPGSLQATIRERARAARTGLERRGIEDPVSLPEGEASERRLDEVRRALGASGNLLCPLNVDGLCTVYESRPIVCRTFGYPADGLAFACEGGNFADPNGEYQSLAGERIEARLARLAEAYSRGTPLSGRSTDNRHAAFVDWSAARGRMR